MPEYFNFENWNLIFEKIFTKKIKVPEFKKPEIRDIIEENIKL